MITVFPAFKALIFPFLLTFATSLSEDLNVIFSCEVNGVRSVFILKVFPFFNVSFRFLTLVTVNFCVLTFFFWTFTSTEADAPLLVVTVMTAVPAFLAFIFPFLVTVATLVSEDSHFSIESPLMRVTFTAVVLFPFCSTRDETFNVTVDAGCGPAVGCDVGVTIGSGAFVGSGVGVTVGSGAFVGSGAGVTVGSGAFVGCDVGVTVGSGAFVGSGVPVGSDVGITVGSGAFVGSDVGITVGGGAFVGCGGPGGSDVGITVGCGAFVGSDVGITVGCGAFVGSDVGITVGSGAFVGCGGPVGLGISFHFA